MSGLHSESNSPMPNHTVPKNHLAAVLHAKGEPFKVESRPTPEPSASEILIKVHSVALNPVDHYQRDMGFQLSFSPAVLGSDISGTVVSTGPSVSSFKVGDRVTAFAPAFDEQGSPDYGAFQEYTLVPAAYAARIPESMSFNEAAMLPMAVETVMAGWYSIGIPKDARFSKEDKKGLLVWGGSSSVGSAAVQIGRIMGFTVYATASPKHHEYIRSLGAQKVFDYKSEGVVEEIVQAAKADGTTLDTAYGAAGAIQQVLDILSQCKVPGTSAKFASAPPLQKNGPTAEGVELKFVFAPVEKEERTTWSSWVFHEWLTEKLDKKELVPSPRMELVPGGLEGVNAGLDKLKSGVSGTKLVLEI